MLREAGHSVFTTARDNSKIAPDPLLDATDFDAVDQVFRQAGRIEDVFNGSGSLFHENAISLIPLETLKKYQQYR